MLSPHQTVGQSLPSKTHHPFGFIYITVIFWITKCLCPQCCFWVYSFMKLNLWVAQSRRTRLWAVQFLAYYIIKENLHVKGQCNPMLWEGKLHARVRFLSQTFHGKPGSSPPPTLHTSALAPAGSIPSRGVQQPLLPLALPVAIAVARAIARAAPLPLGRPAAAPPAPAAAVSPHSHRRRRRCCLPTARGSHLPPPHPAAQRAHGRPAAAASS